MATFRTNPIILKELLESIDSGKVQLPDFQRGWVWDDYRIRALIASISRGFPVGAVMTLQAGGEINFETRLVEGVSGAAKSEVGQFLLDGQQRLTALYQALKSPSAVSTQDSKNRKIKCWYYVDMRKAIDNDIDREEAIVSVTEKERVRKNFRNAIELDLSTPKHEYSCHMMPTERLLDPLNWMFDYWKHWEAAEEKHPEENPALFLEQFKNVIINTFSEYQIPVIDLDKETPKEAVCTIFEKVNTGGVTLTVFDLVTASFAASDFSLRHDWENRRKRLHEKFGLLRNLDGVHFLQAVTLLATQKRRRERKQDQPNLPPSQIPPIGCQKRDILDLTLADYEEWRCKVEEGFTEAAKFLHEQFVFKKDDVPYNTQLVPLAALFVELGREAEPAKARERLEHWYWSGIFGEAYGSAVETQYALDLEQVAEYVRTGAVPRLITEASFSPERLISLRTRNSAAYKGLYALQMKEGASDWRKDAPLALEVHHEESINIHHIFPVAWCKREENRIPPRFYDSIINKTPIDSRTNRIIGGSAPSRYLPKLVESISDDSATAVAKLRSILERHWVNPDLLWENKFAEFFMERGEKMLNLIGKAMGKEITGGRNVFRDALARAGLLPGLDASGLPEADEFEDGEPEYEDEIGSAANGPDDDNL